FASRRRPTRAKRDWSSDVCSSDLHKPPTSLRWKPHRMMPPGVGLVFVHSFRNRQGSDNGVAEKLQKAQQLFFLASKLPLCLRARSEERRVGNGGRTAVQRRARRYT